MNAATAIVTVGAIVVLAGRAMDYFFPPDPSNPRPIPGWFETADGGNRLAEGGNRLGDPQAPVTIVAFGDYQCPFCRRADDLLEELRREHPTDIAVVYRHYPLSIHDSAEAAARVAECAVLSGEFEAVHHSLYKFADSIGVRGWEWFLNEAKVANAEAITDCITSGRMFRAVDRDRAMGDSLGVQATPTLVVGSTMLTGIGDSLRFRRRILRAVKDARH